MRKVTAPEYAVEFNGDDAACFKNDDSSVVDGNAAIIVDISNSNFIDLGIDVNLDSDVDLDIGADLPIDVNLGLDANEPKTSNDRISAGYEKAYNDAKILVSKGALPSKHEILIPLQAKQKNNIVKAKVTKRLNVRQTRAKQKAKPKQRTFMLRSVMYIYLASSMGLLSTILVPVREKTEFHSASSTFVAAWFCLYALSIIFFIRGGFRFSRAHVVVLAVPAYFLLSVMWSNNPSSTVQYSIAFGANILFSMLLFKMLSVSEFVKYVFQILLFMTVIGLGLYFVGYEKAMYLDIHGRSNIFGMVPVKGFYSHKITAGFYAGIGLIMSLVLFDDYKKYLYAAIFLLFGLLSGSSGGLFLATFAVVSVFLIKLVTAKKHGKPMLLFIFLLTIGGSYVFIQFYFYGFLDLVGRDITLTGRTTLWGWGLEVANQRPFFGWGYIGYNGTDIAQNHAWLFREFQNYAVPHFHNSYIQYFAEFGFIVGGFFIFVHLYLVFLIYKQYLKLRSRYMFCLLCVFVYVLVSATFMHSLGRYNDFVMIATAFMFLALINIRGKNRLAKNENAVR